MTYQYTHRCSHHQRHLRGAIKRCIAKDGNATRDKHYQYEEWDET